MKLQLQVEIAENWRRQQEEATEKAKAFEKTREREKTEVVVKNVSPKISSKVSPRISPKDKISKKGKWKKKKAMRHNTKRRASKRVVDMSTSSDSNDTNSSDSEDSSDTEEEALQVIRLLRQEKKRTKSKKSASRGRQARRTQDTAVEIGDDLRRAPIKTYERGDCSKKSTTPTSPENAGINEPMTPLESGYKGISAGFSREGFMDYTMAVMQEYSAKKVHQLRALCEKQGIKFTKKGDMIMELVKRQTELAYEGCFDTPNKKEKTVVGENPEEERTGATTTETGRTTMNTRSKTREASTPRVILRDTALVCPVLYRHAYGKMFVWNPDYQRVHCDETSVLSTCRTAYEYARLGDVGKWKTDEKLGKTYVIPKDKDLNRWRPIAPACDDPAMMGQRRCARALHCLITRYAGQLNFHLGSTNRLADQLRDAVESLRKQGCVSAIGRCYDIKEMFSSIPHDAVRDAVFELLRFFSDRGWRQVRVATRGKVYVMSKEGKGEVGYVKIRFDAIFKMVSYDLDHTYMRCGTTIWRQVVGIPMGKTTSPVLATVTCAMAESKFLRSLGSDRKLVLGWRMVDNVSIIVGCHENDQSQEKAALILAKFEDEYDSRLVLERKDGDNNVWSFIGGRMYVMSDPLQIHYTQETKNTNPLRQHAELQYQFMQDFASYSDKKTKKGVLSTTLKRLWYSTTSSTLCIGSIAYAVIESHLRG
ncbi:hypothetical protein CBR_g22198 [Chara braunii]|uniref:Reverse transcriptase domain-containing protein n=1 Tax=Chara braunii TaxID=69332 RepID=A0A388L2B0_CHABU|nr:hypothetical protein CBR_g22198 [Chara braunii]|eukprot:GBG76450.1 hypothetical protein CBR_g22198 [Chara braunii]